MILHDRADHRREAESSRSKAALRAALERVPARRAQFQSSEEFAELVGPHLPRLVRIARKALHSDDLAWDAVQETLMRIWMQGSLPEDPTAVLTFLVTKSSLHQRRCLARRDRHEANVAHERGACCEEDPLLGLEDAERAEAVRAAIQSISTKYRTVVERADLRGETYQEIAEDLEVPIGTVRSRLNRGRNLVRQRLSSEFPELEETR